MLQGNCGPSKNGRLNDLILIDARGRIAAIEENLMVTLAQIAARASEVKISEVIATASALRNYVINVEVNGDVAFTIGAEEELPFEYLEELKRVESYTRAVKVPELV